LPPYVKKSVESSKKIEITERYQTVYATKEGASAAPTAGLHFTRELLEKIKSKGVKITYVTLHTGLATFKPVYEEEVEKHKMHSEYFEVPKETFEAIEKAERVIAVGTTVVRALETAFSSSPPKLYGETDLFIYPGYKFKVVDALVTNFHWPRSTLIMLVSAFAGKDFIMKAYQEAISRKYRLFSFGDAMLIL
jgi:S-adenosylmethionine:tRNA ribosyltransferase-isomerase